MKSSIAIVAVALAGGCASTTVHTAHSQPTEAQTAHVANLATDPARVGERSPNLSGQWVLNEKASDDPRIKLKEAMGRIKRPGGHGEARGNGGGRGGAGKRGGGGRGAPNQTASRRGAQLEDIHFTGLSKTLEIAHTDPMVVITYEDGRVQRLYTDLRGASISASGSLQQQVTIAGWERGVLIVETTANNGQRLIESYRLQADRKLEVLAEILIPQLADPIRIRKLYEPAQLVR